MKIEITLAIYEPTCYYHLIPKQQKVYKSYAWYKCVRFITNTKYNDLTWYYPTKPVHGESFLSCPFVLSY